MNPRNDDLNQALEHPANSPFEILYDHDVRVVGGRCAAWWRGSSDLNVSVYPDHITHHTGGFRVRRILTELFDYSDDEARRYLLARAGLSTDTPQTRRPFTPPKSAPPPRQPSVQRASGALRQWEKLSETGSSAYLKNKGVDGAACRAIRYGQAYMTTVMSRITAKGDLEPVTVQYIQDDGRKRFAKGMSTRGVCALVGASTLAEAFATGHLWIAEGLATALTVHAATRAPVLCVFNAGNIVPITAELRRRRNKSELKLTVAADDDRFKPEAGNAGLEKAHQAALLHSCRVVSPTFVDLRGKPTDFNDLQLLEGLAEVRQQLLVTSFPNPAHAHAAELRRKRKLSAPNGRNIPTFELADGVTLVRSPQGTGKTEALEPLIDTYQRQGLRVLYLTHRVTLADDAARRLGLDVYSDEALREHLHLAPALACCVNSLHRLLDGDGKLRAFDVVIVDESEQFVRALRGRHISNKKRNLGALEFVLRRADKLVCLDADLGDLTESLLRQVRPHERYHRLEHHYLVGSNRLMRVHEQRDGVYAALSRLHDPVMVVTNSKTEAEAVGAYLAGLGKHGRVLTADRDADDSLLMADLDARTRELDYLVCSPTVSTGVSLTSGHFKHVAGMFYGTVGTPEDALQALWRVRTAVSYDLWLDPRTVYEGIDLAAKYGATKAHEAAALGRTVGYASSFYQALVETSERFEQQAQAHYRRHFLRLAALQGFDFSMLDAKEAEHGLAKEARARADELYRTNIQKARVLEPREAEALGNLKLRSAAERSALERYRISSFYRLDAKDDFTHILEVDRRGRYRRQLPKLERALEDDVKTNNTIDDLITQREMTADLPPVASLKEFHRRVLAAVGFESAAELVLGGSASQLDTPRYTSDSLEKLRRWIEQHRSWIAGLTILPSSGKLAANIIRYVGSWLKALGLKQKRTGKNGAQTYTLELESLKIACQTMKKRGTLSLDNISSTKSVPSNSPPLIRLLQSLRDLVQRAAHSLTRSKLLEFFTLAENGDKDALEALHAYAQKPNVQMLMAAA